MAFKFVVLTAALLAVAQAGLISYAANPSVDAVATTHQNVVRSFGGTVSQYSKSVDTPYSSVRKEDTRISNNVYSPAIAKSVTYAAPAVAKQVTYAAPVVAKQVTYAAPAIAKHVTYAAPAIAKAHYAYAAPAPTAAVYTHAAPVVSKTVYAAPTQTIYAQHEAAPAIVKSVAAPVYHQPAQVTYNHGPAATTYSHNAPGVAAYGSSQTVHYSPAETVSHMSFDGFGTHWGF